MLRYSSPRLAALACAALIALWLPGFMPAARAADSTAFSPEGYGLSLSMPTPGAWTEDPDKPDDGVTKPFWHWKAESGALGSAMFACIELELPVNSVFDQLFRDSFVQGMSGGEDLSSHLTNLDPTTLNGQLWHGLQLLDKDDSGAPLMISVRNCARGNRFYSLSFYYAPADAQAAEALISQTLNTVTFEAAPVLDELVYAQTNTQELGLSLQLPQLGTLYDVTKESDDIGVGDVLKPVLDWRCGKLPMNMLLVMASPYASAQSDEQLGEVLSLTRDTQGLPGFQLEDAQKVQAGGREWWQLRGVQSVATEGVEIELQHEFYFTRNAGRLWRFDFVGLKENDDAAAPLRQDLLSRVSFSEAAAPPPAPQAQYLLGASGLTVSLPANGSLRLPGMPSWNPGYPPAIIATWGSLSTAVTGLLVFQGDDPGSLDAASAPTAMAGLFKAANMTPNAAGATLTALPAFQQSGLSWYGFDAPSSDERHPGLMQSCYLTRVQGKLVGLVFYYFPSGRDAAQAELSAIVGSAAQAVNESSGETPRQ